MREKSWRSDNYFFQFVEMSWNFVVGHGILNILEKSRKSHGILICSCAVIVIVWNDIKFSFLHFIYDILSYH